jgi:outer membrane protein OmpA-like peptidoglycan-associated protein
MRNRASGCVAVILLLTGLAGASQSSESRGMIAEVVRTGSAIVRGIEFAAGSEQPSGGSEAALREVRKMLLEHEEWTFEVQVHTSETGNPDRDQALSTARAKNLVTWLTQHGIAATRLVPRGYGSSKAIPGSSVHDRVELRKLNEE